MSTPTPSTLRPPLAELPSRPLNQRPKPVATTTSPAGVPKSSTNQPLTPPSTPPRPKNIRTSISTDGIETRLSAAGQSGEDQSQILRSTTNGGEEKATNGQGPELKLYSKRYRLHEELGHGVWSNVYCASELPQSTIPDIFPLSPPTSPTNGALSSSPKALAVKRPSRRDAYKILENEAKILTLLQLDERASSYVVFFHGFDATHQSIVLDAVPLNLEAHAKSTKKRPLSIKTMFDPIIGAEEWASLADYLISGLAFLHSKGCVHGDIKPANILLRSHDNYQMMPLYCDFSSSRIAHGTPSEGADEVSAVTADYTSPELLEALHKRNNNRAVANFASDVFALAVTILFAATAESPYACARMDFQRLGMAKEGTPLEYARRGEQASRIMKGRAVERALKSALDKDPDKRSEVGEWKATVQNVCQSWRNGGWLRGGE